ncbi:MAG: hypothetical protein IH986_18485 [Planctomycetes bacterium]|nr:hypothetical protein [Planctomycetota bacterium]
MTVDRFAGTPLEGLPIRVLPNEAGSDRVGFSIVTRTGPVQVLYAPGPAGVCRFASVDRVAKFSPVRVWGRLPGPPVRCMTSVVLSLLNERKQ